MLSRPLYTSIVLTVLVVAVILFSQNTRQLESITSNKYAPPVPSDSEQEYLSFRLKETSTEYGLVAQHRQLSHHLNTYSDAMGGGICVFDFNNDGWMDVFVVGGSGLTREYGKQSWWHSLEGNQLFENKNGNFENVTRSAGIVHPVHGIACGTADLDGDGDTDLTVSGLGGTIVYSNTGNGEFTKIDIPSLSEPNLWTTQLSFSDFNDDGLVDIYISNFVEFKKGSKTFENNRGFESTMVSDFDPTLFDPQPNQLLVNKGNFQFSRVDGLRNVLGRTIGARWTDLNDDGKNDLIVLNDFNTPNRVYLADKQGGFIEGGDEYQAFSLVGTRDLSESTDHTTKSQYYYFTRSTGEHNVRIYRKITNSHDILINNVEWSGFDSGKHLYSSDWGGISLDIDNNGLLDFYISAGKASSDADAQNVTQPQPNTLLLMNDEREYVGVSGEDKSVAPKSSRGVVSADLDNDGQLEIIVANNNDFIQVLTAAKSNSNHWVGIDVPLQSQFIGAKVIVSTAESTFSQTVSYKQNIFSQSDHRLHFGLGKTEEILKLEIVLTDGKTLEFKNLTADRYYKLNTNDMGITVTQSLSSKRTDVHNYKDLESAEGVALLSANKITDSEFDIISKVIWQKSSSSQKVAILKLLNSRNQLSHLLFLALKDESKEVVIEAIHSFQRKELELSVDWLIPILENPDDDVFCEVAKTFQFFYEQEEAVTFRKYRAVTPMIKQFERMSEVKKVCTLKSLAAAENTRVVPALTAYLKNKNNPVVLANIIRTLGLVRDSRAESDILNILRTNPAPMVTAQSMIALRRLESTDLNSEFIKVFSADQQNGNEKLQRSRLNRINTLLSLYEQSGTLVIPESWLTSAFSSLAIEIERYGSDAEKILLLKAIYYYGGEQYFPVLNALLKSESASVNLLALQIGYMLGEGDLRKQITDKIMQMETGRFFSFISGLLELRNVSIPREAILRLSKFSSPKSAEGMNVIEIVSKLQIADLNIYLELTRNSASPQFKSIILETLFVKRLRLQEILNYIGKPELDAKLRIIEYFYNNFELFDKQEVLQVRLMLKEVVSSDDITSKEKVDSLVLAAAEDNNVVIQYFTLISQQRSRLKVLSLLEANSNFNRIRDIEDFVKSTLTSGDASVAEKLMASYVLRE